MYRFFVQPEQIHGKTVKIQGSEVNHIKNVLRMKSGEQIRISDGKSMDYLCEIETLEEDAYMLLLWKRGRAIQSFQSRSYCIKDFQREKN